MKRAHPVLLVLGLSLAAGGCENSEDIFVGQRIENLCNGSIPVCGKQAGCVLATDQFLRGRFPGGEAVIVETESDKTRLVTRVLLEDEVFPGSEFFVRAYDVGCEDFHEKAERDRNLFEFAGDDGVIEFHLDVNGRGDHLIEFFSDLGSTFLFTIDTEE